MQVMNLPRVDSGSQIRDLLLDSESQKVIGLIIFIEGHEAECLGLLTRLSEHGRSQPVLVVGTESHTALAPVLIEAGCSVLTNVVNDQTPAEWCLRVLTTSL